MNEAMIIHHAGTAMLLVLLLSMPPIIVATVVGVLVSLLQALTQIQEQTLGCTGKGDTVVWNVLVGGAQGVGGRGQCGRETGEE